MCVANVSRSFFSIPFRACSHQSLVAYNLMIETKQDMCTIALHSASIVELQVSRKEKHADSPQTSLTIEIDGGEVRLLNDDEVLATVQDPTDILHKF